ncbi:CD82 antigen [Chanos chanos]|uniref:CD82 antigen n=1 Tax=Chanos chanos TaxID=29144 RepID=A0A6J2VE13_CHACN|nr:CD82 antigen-like [Chanos chanos]
MKAEDKLQILKFVFSLFNTLFVIVGLSIFGCAVWILFDATNFIHVVNSGEHLLIVAVGLFVIGLVVVIVSLIGCTGVHLENRCCIAFYMGFLVAVALGQLFVTFILLFYRNKIDEHLTETVEVIITEYGSNKTQTSWDLLDSLQHTGKCCGMNSPSDWQMNKYIQSLNKTEDMYPRSCFNTTCPGSESDLFWNCTEIYTAGCKVALSTWLNENVLVMVGMDIGLLLIEVLQCVLGIYTFRSIGQKSKEQLSKNLLNSMETDQQYDSSNDPNYDLGYDPHHNNPMEIYDQSYGQDDHEGDSQHYSQNHNQSNFQQYDPGQNYSQNYNQNNFQQYDPSQNYSQNYNQNNFQ